MKRRPDGRQPSTQWATGANTDPSFPLRRPTRVRWALLALGAVRRSLSPVPRLGQRWRRIAMRSARIDAVQIDLEQALPRLERHVLIVALGLLHGVHEGIWTPDDAESLLFKPATLSALEERSVSTSVLDFIQRGFFLDDVSTHGGSEALQDLVAQLQRLGLALLQDRSD